ncbi:hypothetical protein LTR64_003262 [Lithohypha guttulata]|uniref:uncharacterized protein n=1 Tax=Lithohypha guttulata TaxID=1690604 RepID=UPI002DE194F5|nr:hypothetical protein LTR51_000518 [Lithohypha guttulata]
MPPPIPAHQKRFTANPTRPARYRPGKAVPEDESDENLEDEEEEEVSQPVQPQRRLQAPPAGPTRPQAEDEEEDDEEGFVTEDEDDADGGAPLPKPAAKPVAQTARTLQPSAQTSATPVIPEQVQDGHEDEDESAGSEEEEEEESEEGSEEEGSTSEEEEAPQRRFQRPTFIKKTERKPTSASNADVSESATPAPEIASSHHNEDIAARRLREAESLIKTTIERDTAARLAGRKDWDDDDDLPPEALVDDTDGLDPEAEHSAWRLRELHRLKRDREAMIAREKELEEIERRRNLTIEEREAEDKEYIAKQKEEREEGRAKSAYLSKYHHKGAFFMDDEESARLAKRDLIGAKFADDVDKSTLPEYMRIRDMTKLGKKGRTRYTDLKGQDTGRFGDEVKRWRGSGYNDRNDGQRDDIRGVDDRFLPDNDRERGGPQVTFTFAADTEKALFQLKVSIKVEVEVEIPSTQV